MSERDLQPAQQVFVRVCVSRAPLASRFGQFAEGPLSNQVWRPVPDVWIALACDDARGVCMCVTFSTSKSFG
jgi:hypothetical protein